jgi:predicted Fe-Mo cluster-binding NifX family protein
MEEKQIIIANYENEIDAEIAKGHLESSGISASVIKDDGGSMLPSMQITEGVQLVVTESQSEKAKKILQAKSI